MEDSLADSVRRSVDARGPLITGEDRAVVDLALRYARQIDAGIAEGGQDATKALYLGPHLLKALGALGCTPEARGDIEPGDGKLASVTPQSKLATMRAKRASGGGA